MKTAKRFILTLAAIFGMTGAWAQDAEEVTVTKTANKNEWTLTMPASDVELQVEYYMPFDLTLADGSNAHGTVAFTVGDAAATQALKDDVVTVSVTPADGYTVKGVTAQTSSQEAVSMSNGGNGWTFTMPEENVAVTVTYAKNLQDAWIQDIADQTYTGEALTPAVVKDGGTTLTEGTDYTAAYENNVNVGMATVTITAKEGSDYSGTATKTFTIAKANITMTTAPAAIENLTYSGSAQTLISAGVASFGTVLYSLDGTNFSDALPQGTAAGAYTVTYKVEGDANHNALDAASFNVTIAEPAEGASITVALTEEYATYCSDYALDFSGATGLEAYIAAGYNTSDCSLLMVKVTSVPAGTGLLLKSSSATGGDFTAKVKASPYVYSNLLTGTTAQTTVSGSDFILGKKGDKVGFYRAGDGTLAAGKAYLKGLAELATPSAARIINLVFDDDATAIENYRQEASTTNDWYTLDGRKLEGKPTRKGLYVKNGKKVVVR